MPVHRIPSGPNESDLDVVEDAVKKIERLGEEIVHVSKEWLGFPLGVWVIFTRGGRKTERRTA